MRPRYGDKEWAEDVVGEGGGIRFCEGEIGDWLFRVFSDRSEIEFGYRPTFSRWADSVDYVARVPRDSRRARALIRWLRERGARFVNPGRGARVHLSSRAMLRAAYLQERRERLAARAV